MATKKSETVITTSSQGKLHLTKGIYNDGTLIKDLAYDLDEVTADLYMEADTKATQKKIEKGNGVKLTVSNFDDVSRLYYGWACVLAAKDNEKYGFDFDNISLLKGPDIKRVANIGSVFLADLGEDASPENSEQQ